MRDPGAEPRLVVPEGLVVDENVRERLERQLSLAPADVLGVAAEVAELEPGTSYRVHAEWLALADTSLRPLRSGSVRGAVLLRPGVEFVIRDGAVDVADVGVMVDPGARVHDPHRPIGELEVATDRGRPPFPRRPVVVFLGCERNLHADWLRRLVNRLVRHEVEARIATPADGTDAGAGAGVHLTRPCLPVEATIRALAPDVVVTLDRGAAATIDAWCAGDRSTVLIEFDRHLSQPMELVPWQIGRASGRLRARIGPWVDVPAFVSLVGRLCAGPQPMPPVDAPESATPKPPVHEHWTTHAAIDAAHRCVVLTGPLDPRAAARVEGLVDNLEAAGVPVEVSKRDSGSGFDATARTAGLAVLAGMALTPEIDALLAARRATGLITAVDLGPHDLEPAPAGTEHSPAVLSPAAAALAAACDLVVSPAGALHSAAGASGRRALMVPTLLTRARAAALRDARAVTDPTSVLIIGWRIDAASGGPPAYAAAVAEGIARILTEHRDRVEIAGDAEQVPEALRGHERVTVVPGGDLAPAVIARWAVHVWTPSLLAGEIVDDARLLEEAGSAGVPSVMPADATTGVDGFVSPFVLADAAGRADDWYDALHHVLDNAGVQARRADEAARRADALDGPAASKAVVSRLMGLARYRLERA